ncbi:group II intron reverse transcriptase/maturase [Allocoleopsis franciscana]|uniref:Retron-type reverse transcriptase n=1 Tax=Allocoleopsis franciscana PCC 7113 TaxID=1173027 RepID=K9WF64_9CYAN|nr:group II intron reverse transcriptase/maturase [Allocoleopsis franciscana]AFZ19045.1 Retron-type reverse transcriptase [Allocoleopsis franciscana PCC 7113]
MNTEQPMYEWNKIPWRKHERMAFKLQKRIYQASSRGDVRTVRRLQKLLMKSWSARCLAVRRVTQDNQGKKTAGVDGQRSLTPKQRQNLIGQLKLGTKVSPTRRVWIPKPGKEEKRPLGIPTMKDRALQALVKLALEPEWEAQFEPNSYGFRPGRSCQDAISAIQTVIKQKAKYVLDADIAQCFDRIDHEALLNKLNTSPTIRRQIRAWLKAGVMDNMQYFDTSEGTPQGGVISPLLANIALHGMEWRIKEYVETCDLKRSDGKYQLPKRDKRDSVSIIRYADDFVILHNDITVVQGCREVISEWLKGMGLELKPSKTRIAHTLNEHGQEKPGFNFLGYYVRQFPVGKYTTGKDTKGKPLGFKTIITPSKEKCKVHYDQIKRVINDHKGSSQKSLIDKLNPIIRGWTNYYSTVNSSKAFKKLDANIYIALKAWAKSRHRNKGEQWLADKYWKTIGGDNWVFATRQGEKHLRLLKHRDTNIRDYVKVKGEASPYDGNLIYWSIRMGKNPEMPKRTASLLKQQKGKCAHCGLYLKDGDVIERDHIIPKSLGGKDEYKNWQLLHRHCHDIKTALDGSYGTKSDCNSVEPKPPVNSEWFWENDMLAMRFV